MTVLFTSVSSSLTKQTYKKCSTEPHHNIFMILFVTLHSGLALWTRVLWVRHDKGPAYSLFCLFLDGCMQGKCQAGRHNNASFAFLHPKSKTQQQCARMAQNRIFVIKHCISIYSWIAVFPQKCNTNCYKTGQRSNNLSIFGTLKHAC